MLTHLEPVTDGQIFLKGKNITHVGRQKLKENLSGYPDGFSDANGILLTRDVLWATELGKGSHCSDAIILC